jgi:hypothetical protein
VGIIHSSIVFIIVLMRHLEDSYYGRAVLRHTSFILICILLGASMMPFANYRAEAAFHTLVSDTISNSGMGVASNHVVAWTSANTVGSGLTMKIQFDPTGDLFDLSSVVAGDVSVTGMSLVANFAACNVGPDKCTPPSTPPPPTRA